MGGKGFLLAALIIGAVVAADQHYNSGYYTDGAMAMLQQIRQSFRF